MRKNENRSVWACLLCAVLMPALLFVCLVTAPAGAAAEDWYIVHVHNIDGMSGYIETKNGCPPPSDYTLLVGVPDDGHQYIFTQYATSKSSEDYLVIYFTSDKAAGGVVLNETDFGDFYESDYSYYFYEGIKYKCIPVQLLPTDGLGNDSGTMRWGDNYLMATSDPDAFYDTYGKLEPYNGLSDLPDPYAIDDDFDDDYYVSAVSFTPPADVSYSEHYVALSTETEGANIYYTTDDSIPSEDSTLYTEPFLISENTTIRAFAVLEGMIDSPVTEKKYVILPEGTESEDPETEKPRVRRKQPKTLTLSMFLRQIGEEAFAGGTFEAVIIPEGCRSIGPRAFANCANLVYVRIPATMETIAEDAFDGCPKVMIDREQ